MSLPHINIFTSVVSVEALMSIFPLSFLLVCDEDHILVFFVDLLSRNIIFSVQRAFLFIRSQ